MRCNTAGRAAGEDSYECIMLLLSAAAHDVKACMRISHAKGRNAENKVGHPTNLNNCRWIQADMELLSIVVYSYVVQAITPGRTRCICAEELMLPWPTCHRLGISTFINIVRQPCVYAKRFITMFEVTYCESCSAQHAGSVCAGVGTHVAQRD